MLSLLLTNEGAAQSSLNEVRAHHELLGAAAALEARWVAVLAHWLLVSGASHRREHADTLNTELGLLFKAGKVGRQVGGERHSIHLDRTGVGER